MQIQRIKHDWQWHEEYSLVQLRPYIEGENLDYLDHDGTWEPGVGGWIAWRYETNVYWYVDPLEYLAHYRPSDEDPIAKLRGIHDMFDNLGDQLESVINNLKEQT